MMIKLVNFVLILLILAGFVGGGIVLVGKHIMAECNNKGHFTLADETYLCRPIGKLTEGIKR